MCINKHMRNIVKFKSIEIALWIEKGQKILIDGLKQLI